MTSVLQLVAAIHAGCSYRNARVDIRFVVISCRESSKDVAAV